MAINYSPDLLRAARALVGWSQSEIAAAANVSRPTINRLETGGNATVETIKAIVNAFAKQGVEFTDSTSEHGAGVRWEAPTRRVRNPSEDEGRAKG